MEPTKDYQISLHINSVEGSDNLILEAPKYGIAIGPMEPNEVFDLLHEGSIRKISVWRQIQTAFHIGRKQGRRDSIGPV